MKIGINCGHTLPNGGSQGAVGFINESTEVRNVGYILEKLLQEQGHTVINCTNDYAKDANDNLKQIVSLENQQPLDFFISIHFNAGGGKGTEVYTYGGTKSKAYNEAKKITQQISELGFINRGVKDGSKLYVLKNTKSPSLLIECCFVDNMSDVELYKKLGAQQLAAAVAKTFGKAEDSMSKFTDIKGHYAEKHIEKLEKYGIVNGDGKGKFRPDEPVTRADAAIMIANALTVAGK